MDAVSIDWTRARSKPSRRHSFIERQLGRLSGGRRGSYIVVPSTVYARINSEFVDFGLENPGLVQILQPIHADILEGEECCAGNDDTIWPNAHIDDSLFANPVKP
ncbi:hypothetical protein EDD15DRAFT_4011 [Pisolithus albus]|nr:hypothetical protein EDD15DRAFT_4011 [Pisolithus albus]